MVAVASIDDVVTCDYNDAMKTAGVRELRARFSAYLREVERGEVVLVTDHGRVVAELRLPGVADRAASPDDLRYRRLVESGRLVPGARAEARAWPPAPSVRLAPGSAAALLDAERGDR
jgi:antitoxin (DNA-binding transcriptional repressor) of toxin-antitoxin stability system